MHIIWKILRYTGILLGSLIILIIIIVSIFLNFNPRIGGNISKEQREAFAATNHYTDGKFVNQEPTNMDMGFSDMLGVINKFVFNPPPGREPKTPPPVLPIDSLNIVNKPLGLERLTWFGHSACLLEIEGKRIFFDPMLGDYAGPSSLISPKRYNKTLPISIEQLPYIDAVILSHDHYDHLDYGSILQLKDKVGHFYVPLGVGAHLVAWGVQHQVISELDWWQEVTADGFTYVLTPARHFSGRGMFNRFSTLWGSWVVKTANTSIYFSGDSGYGSHFKEIGERYGPFDLAMMECGQYNELWHDIHLMPEETVQAGMDVRSKLLMPIHWGAFSLALHTWTDPADRVIAEANVKGVAIATPIIGEPLLLHESTFPDKRWWR